MRRLEGRGAAEVVPLAVLQEKLVELLLLSSRRLSQQLAEEGSHGGGTHTTELSAGSRAIVARKRAFAAGGTDSGRQKTTVHTVEE